MAITLQSLSFDNIVDRITQSNQFELEHPLKKFKKSKAIYVPTDLIISCGITLPQQLVKDGEPVKKLELWVSDIWVKPRDRGIQNNEVHEQVLKSVGEPSNVSGLRWYNRHLLLRYDFFNPDESDRIYQTHLRVEKNHFRI